MKKRVLSLALVSAMALSLVACGSKTAAPAASSDAPAATEAADTAEAPAAEAAEAPAGDHTLTVAAWDENFNIPALKAAAEDYKEVDPEFDLVINLQSQSSDVENAITAAAESGDYSNVSDIVLFQDHYFQQYCTNYPDAWISADDADVDWSGLGAEKLSYSTVNGVHYGFPVDAGTAIFAYNTKYLGVCLGHSNFYVVLGFLQVCRGGLEVEFAEFYPVVDVEAVENGDVSAQAE